MINKQLEGVKDNFPEKKKRKKLLLLFNDTLPLSIRYLSKEKYLQKWEFKFYFYELAPVWPFVWARFLDTYLQKVNLFLYIFLEKL